MPTLRVSATGPYVEMAQLALARAGFLQEAPDGVFGARTFRAVEQFQLANGLVADGVIGPATWRALAPYLRGYTTVTAGRGDTFWSLARRYGTTTAAIAAANPGVVPENLPVGSRLTVPFGFEVVPANVSYTSDLLTYITQGLTARYPFMTASSIGQSVMGRPLRLLTMGQGARQVFINAAHHANEWITVPLVLRFTERYAKAVTAGGSVGGLSARTLYDRATLYTVPMVNPDGVDLVTGALNSGAYYRQAVGFAANYPAIPFPAGWKANVNGVDLNLQYPAGWEQAREIKFAQGFRLPGPRDYVGTAALTQPESRAMADFTRSRDFHLILAYHTQGELIYYKFADYDPPRADEIGRALAEASGYSLEITPYGSGFAGYKDWFIQTYNRPGYTVEAGRGSNPLPLSQFNAIYRDNEPLMAKAIKLA